MEKQAVKEIAKLLTCGKGGVTAHPGKGTTISGYVGHDWTDDTDETTVAIDSREIPYDVHAKLAIAGPMVNVDLPDGLVDRVFEGRGPFEVNADGTHNARSLDYVSLDVYAMLYERAGAKVYRGATAVEFAKSISHR